MSTASERKKAARQHFRAVRKSISPEERARIDRAIVEWVMALPEFVACDVLLPYLSFGAEVETRDLIRGAWKAEKVVALPWCVPGTREMRWFRVSSLDNLVKSSFGVEEPVPDAASELDPSGESRILAVVPGLTFDVRGHRLGYGGGFYDAFLSSFAGVSVGLCRSAQLSHEVAGIEDHDQAVDIVATEDGVVRTA